MKPKIKNIIISIFIAGSIIFYPVPALSVFPENMNFLISGTVYLRRSNWASLRLTASPTLLGLSDRVMIQQGMEAVVMCADFSKHDILSEQELSINTICPSRGNNQPIPNNRGNTLPTSQEVESNPDLRETPTVEKIEEESGTNFSVQNTEEIIDQLSKIEMSSSIRAFVTAQFYISRGLENEAISLLESFLSFSNIPSRTLPLNIDNYQLLGNLYELTEQYDKAEAIHRYTLSSIREIEIEVGLNEGALGAFSSTRNLIENLYQREGFSPTTALILQDLLLANKAELLLSVGQLSLKDDDYREAVNYLKTARDLYLQLEGENSPTARTIEIQDLENSLMEIEIEAELLRERLQIQESDLREIP